MANTPYAKILVSVNNGPNQSGALVVPAGAIIKLQPESTIGWEPDPVALWEIYGFPPSGFAAPAGWTNGGFGSYFYVGNGPPPAFALPSLTTAWGKFMFRLTVNGGQRNGAASRDMTDVATALSVLSPMGLEDIGYLEDTQFDPIRAWLGALQRNLRVIDAKLAGASKAPVMGSGITTDATTPVPVLSFDVPVGSLLFADAMLTALVISGSHAGQCFGVRSVALYKNVTGTPTLVLPSTPQFGVEVFADETGGAIDPSTFAASFSGITATATVKGIADNTIQWTGAIR
jgi:hypothetical protein